LELVFSLVKVAGTTGQNSAAPWGAVISNQIMESLLMAEAKSLSGLTPDQAKEFHEQFKVTYTAFVGLAAVAHILVIGGKPWF
jgi:light-harvesting complex 1 beta chain